MQWYFDFISPYAYLQSTRLDDLNRVRKLTCVPILFAGLLKHWETIGPAETPPKRQWTFRDIVWEAHRDNIPLQLPPHHPFNPLPLLRLSQLHNNDMATVQRIFRFVWQEGCVPQDEEAFAALLDELNTCADAINSEAVKAALYSNAKQAIEQNVFGVPTICKDGELFWGYSATDMVIQSETDQYPRDALRKADHLPEGISRKIVSKNKSTQSETPRIPLKPIDIAEPAELVNIIRKRRGGELLALDRLLLYSAPLASGWNHFLGNVREHFSVEQKLRELAMCTVAVLNNASYEFQQHAPLYIAAGGTEAKTKLLSNPKLAASHVDFDLDEQITIALTQAMTNDISIDDTLFTQALNYFGEEKLVELVATIAAYNMVSRFLVAFELH